MTYTVEKTWTTAADYTAVIIMVEREPYSRNHRCGYVAIPEDHPAFQKHYDSQYIDCHGGLTYSGGNEGYPIHITDKKVWWFGFDCGHYGDDEEGGQSLDYVTAECESIATQFLLQIK